MQHQIIENAAEFTRDIEVKVTPETRITRWMRDCLDRQRPDFREGNGRGLEDLGEEEAAWMRQLANIAQSRFVEDSIVLGLDLLMMRSDRLERMWLMLSRVLPTTMGWQ